MVNSINKIKSSFHQKFHKEVVITKIEKQILANKANGLAYLHAYKIYKVQQDLNEDLFNALKSDSIDPDQAEYMLSEIRNLSINSDFLGKKPSENLLYSFLFISPPVSEMISIMAGIGTILVFLAYHHL